MSTLIPVESLEETNICLHLSDRNSSPWAAANFNTRLTTCCNFALLEANITTSSAYSRSTNGRAEGAKMTSAEHCSTALRIISSTAKLNRKSTATARCLTTLSTPNNVVQPAGIRTAAVVLPFMLFIRRTNFPGTPSSH
ncbi:hypothetical protein RB195_011936 [Necator americanus]|uniref:Uncharacterized protein n=1 Tax=Necator americanus TaxID=51031 RepID=A0ABR1D4P7_NECAM